MENSFCVKSFLKDLGLEEYCERFINQGYEQTSDLFGLSNQDLISLCIQNETHKKAILKAVDELPVKLWLEEHKLKQYQQSFEDEDLKILKDVRLKLNRVTDFEYMLDKLDVMVPGHRKRLSLAVQSLSNTCIIQCGSSGAVAKGSWKRPSCGHFGKLQNLFLCVKGCFKSAKDVDKQSEELEFVVDSASEVVTARQSIINDLGLVYIDHIDSFGIHTSAKMPIYRGSLRLGDSDWINVEVMEGDYESVGAPVMREFQHIIDRETHQWIPVSPKQETATGSS